MSYWTPEKIFDAAQELQTSGWDRHEVLQRINRELHGTQVNIALLASGQDVFKPAMYRLDYARQRRTAAEFLLRREPEFDHPPLVDVTEYTGTIAGLRCYNHSEGASVGMHFYDEVQPRFGISKTATSVSAFCILDHITGAPQVLIQQP